MAIPQGPNQRWSLDFLSADDRRFRILAIVDNFTCECLALVPDTSLPGLRVVRELNAVITVRGRPVSCVSEFTGVTMLSGRRNDRSSGTTLLPASPTPRQQLHACLAK
jgi:putative transposase